MTEKNWKKLIATIQEKHQIRQEFLTVTFSKISEAELISEFQKRVANQTIKLSLNPPPNQGYISVETKEAQRIVFTAYLPIEVKAKDHD